MMPGAMENADGTATPRPDPTVLTTEALLREIGALRTLIGERITATESLFDTKIQLGREGGMALKEYFQVQHADLITRLAERGERTEILMAEKFEGRDKALVAALAAAEKAVEKANTGNDKRFDTVNEQLSALTALISSLLPRAEAESRISDLDRRVSEVKSAVDTGFTGVDVRRDTSGESREDNRATIAVYVAVASVILTLIFTVVTTLHALH